MMDVRSVLGSARVSRVVPGVSPDTSLTIPFGEAPNGHASGVLIYHWTEAILLRVKEENFQTNPS